MVGMVGMVNYDDSCTMVGNFFRDGDSFRLPKRFIERHYSSDIVSNIFISLFHNIYKIYINIMRSRLSICYDEKS